MMQIKIINDEYKLESHILKTKVGNQLNEVWKKTEVFLRDGFIGKDILVTN